jgi:hypothetical protein
LVSRGSLGEASQGFILLDFIFFSSTFTLWAFIPFFPQVKVQPFDSLANPMPELVYGMDEWEKDEKW